MTKSASLLPGERYRQVQNEQCLGVCVFVSEPILCSPTALGVGWDGGRVFILIIKGYGFMIWLISFS